MSLRQENVSSIGEVIDKANQIVRSWTPSIRDPEEIWFRGQPKAQFGLLPGLYRPDNLRLHYNEVALFERFMSLATPYLRRTLTSEWEWYFLAQHFGLPTRLLDWTENLLAAVYFAVCGSIFCSDRLKLEDEMEKGRQKQIFDCESPCVWILDAGTLNKSLHGEDVVFVPGLSDKLTSSYLPDAIANKRNAGNVMPVAILPPRANERITAQQGVFTVHGKNPRSLEALASSSPKKAPIHLARINLDRANLAFLWTELQFAGINRLSLFPDIDSVAFHVKWLMQSAH